MQDNTQCPKTQVLYNPNIHSEKDYHNVMVCSRMKDKVKPLAQNRTRNKYYDDDGDSLGIALRLVANVGSNSLLAPSRMEIGKWLLLQ